METKNSNSKAYVGINVKPDFEKRALTEIRNSDGVEEAYHVHAAYDIFAKIGGESTMQIKDKVKMMREKLPYITSHTTLLIV